MARRGAREVIFEQLPGLDLRDQSGILGALDLADVRWTPDGSLASRDGSETWTAVGILDASSAHPFTSTGGVRRLITSSFSRLQAWDQNGVALATTADNLMNTRTCWTAARVGVPGAESILLGGTDAGGGVYPLVKYDFSAGFSQIFTGGFTQINTLTGVETAVYPPGGPYAIIGWPSQGRLVMLMPNGASPVPWGDVTLDPSQVWFSEPGAPTRVRSDSFARLGVGDGEQLQGGTVWRDLLFVFKETRFWVFAQPTVTSIGSVRWNRRVVDSGVGCVAPAAVAAGPDAVYFVADRGVYRTTGGEPQCISDAISPLWGTIAMSPFYTGPRMDLAPANRKYTKLEWIYDSLYFTFWSTATKFATFVWHQPTQRWSYWSLPARAVFGWSSRNAEEPHFIHDNNWGGTNDGRLSRVRPGLAGDAKNPAVMAPFYEGPFARVADGRVARVRDLKVIGAGSVDIGMNVDFVRDTRKESLVITPSLTTREAMIARANHWRGAHMGVRLGFTPATKAGEKQFVVGRVTADVSGARHRAIPDGDG